MENFRLLMTFTYPHEAHMAKGYLESEGVEAIIQDEISAQFLSNAIGGIRLLVRENDIEKGIEILKAGGYRVLTGNIKKKKIEKVYFKSNREKEHCPFCNSTNVSKTKAANLIMVLLLVLTGVFFPVIKRSYLCFDCKKEWKFIKEF